MVSFQGYFEGGKFFPMEAVTIPDRKRTIVTVLDEEITNTKHAAAWRKFLEEIATSDEEIPTHFDRVSFNREVDL